MSARAERPVLPFARPPIHQATTVRVARAAAFDGFVRTIGRWWPVQPFSAGGDRVRDVLVDGRPGGRVVETWADGTEVAWGELRVWEPSHRFVMSWTMTPAPTEVEFTFAELGPALTRVSVQHRGWEALSDEQLEQDCALPRGYQGGAYEAGWARILAAFADAVSTGDAPAPDDRPDQATRDEAAR